MDDFEYNVQKNALMTYGPKGQLIKTVSDLEMLRQALEKTNNGKPDIEEIVKDIVEVDIMLQQVIMHFNLNKKVDKAKEIRLKELGKTIGVYEEPKRIANKLSEEDVENIRQLYVSGQMNQYELARLYNVNPASVSEVVRGVTHSNARGPIAKGRQYKIFSNDEVTAIRQEYEAGGITQAELAEKYDSEVMTINSIITGKTYKEAGGPITKKGKGGYQEHLNKLDTITIQKIGEEWKKGTSLSNLSSKFGVSKRLINKLIDTVIIDDNDSKALDINAGGKIKLQVIEKFSNHKGVMRRSLKEYVVKSYEPKKSLEQNLASMKIFARENEWNPGTKYACNNMLRQVYKES